MFEPAIIEEVRSPKRSSDYEDSSSSPPPSKRSKFEDDEQSDNSTADNEIEDSTTDAFKLDPLDDHSDCEDLQDDSNISTDQSSYSVLCNRTQPSSRYARTVIQQFQYLCKHTQTRAIEPTRCANTQQQDQIKKLSWKSLNSLQRKSLLKEGFAVLSDQVFPFHSLCYMCGSVGDDLIYCNSCCEAYHTGCLNECERSQFYPPADSWLCPNCNLCTICGLTSNSPIIICYDCKKSFHIKCLKSIDDVQQEENLSNRPSRWYCPLCIKCDCGQRLTSHEANLSQQSLMCSDCSTNLQRLQSNRHRKIEKCHLCEKFIEQFIQKAKPLFPRTLIGDQSKHKENSLFQCTQCKHHFHPICDGYLVEDVLLVSYLDHLSTKIICSKCDDHQTKDCIQQALIHYKLQTMKNTIASLTSTLQILILEENRLSDMKRYMFNLQQLHQSRNPSVNLHGFLNDLLIIVQRLLNNLDIRQWQAAIDNCIISQCPWFQRSNNCTIYCSSVNPIISPTNTMTYSCLPSPSIDHEYSFNNERILFRSNLYKTNLLTSSDTLLDYIDQKFKNLHQIDSRMCQLCQTYADHFSSNISRLITIGINQWVHIGCILPAYSHTLDQPPYILHNALEVVHRCQKQYRCEICSKLGASVQCYVSDCPVRFHCQCLEMYYSKFDRSLQEKWKMIDGLLPNLMTYCSKHNRTNEDERRLPPINLSSPVYADLSDASIERSFTDIQLCIGSLQIHSLGDLDYRLDDDPARNIYPNKYHASRLFWSTRNAQQKTVYHLHIEIEQTYHHDRSQHRTIAYPLSKEQLHLQELYDRCGQYFHQMKRQRPLQNRRPKSVLKNRSNQSISIDTKSLRSLFTNHSLQPSDTSPFALALAQALEQIDQSIPSTNTPLFSFYLPEKTNGTTMSKTRLLDSHSSIPSMINKTSIGRCIPQIDGTLDDNSPTNQTSISSDVLIELYKAYSVSKFGRRRFIITSNDGYRIVSDNLDQAWSTIVNQIRECRDDMNLTHISFSNELLSGHHIFGLKKSILRIINSPSNPHQSKRSTHRSCNSRSTIYRRKTSQRQRFNWLSNPHRTIENALSSFEMNSALTYARRILLEEPSVSLRLSHLHYFSEHVLIVGSSAIHGCGLFTLIDLIEGQMITEYTGEVVRPSLTDKREIENEEKGFGCYMFTVDSLNVIDATHQGNQARFINHHCQPNCFAKTVISGGIKHIVIYALVDISQGTELTYDYSFAEEDIKIPCHCGTSTCRMYLN